ncbi:hypothetical protein [Yersinia aldovae]|uniref:hypothetical protein n=1 Tax=Yersinia aldovae TaxID=29483 RepID=UPI0011A2DC7E|nr:hypothetical protein [Yersinia aldovae]
MLLKISKNDNVSDKIQMTSISILDANLFFASGLYFIYFNYFGNDISVNISPSYSDDNRFRNSVKVYYSDGKSRLINIETRPQSLLNKDDECIYRCDEVKDIIRKTNGSESELKN